MEAHRVHAPGHKVSIRPRRQTLALRSQAPQGSDMCPEHMTKHRFRGWEQGLGQLREVSVTPVPSVLLVFSLDQRTLYGRHQVKVRQDYAGLVGYQGL